MNIPAEVLPRVKCDNCELYLSCGPIYCVYNNNDKVYCGRCKISENEETKEPPKKIRVMQLEAYAELFEYPCKYEENGCRKKLPFALSQHVHEQNCEFKPHVCPVAPFGSCDWLGSWNSLIEHCKLKHPNQIFENNCELKHNFRVSNFEAFILTAYNILFLLQFKICTKTAKIYYSIRLLGDSNQIKNYSFEIVVERGESKITKKGEILSEQYLTLQETTALKLHINSLLDIFNESLDDVKFKIFIKTSILNCKYCGKRRSKRIQDDLICNNCAKNVRTCKFQSKGCLYKDFSWKCWKHELFYCKFIEDCPKNDCEQELKTGETVINHYVNVHEALLCNIASKFRIPFSNDACTRKWFILSSDIGNVFCECKCYDKSINMFIASPLTSKELNNIECKVTIEDPTTFNKQTITFDQYDSWDYYTHEIEMNDFPSWQSNNVGVDVKININKV